LTLKTSPNKGTSHDLKLQWVQLKSKAFKQSILAPKTSGFVDFSTLQSVINALKMRKILINGITDFEHDNCQSY